MMRNRFLAALAAAAAAAVGTSFLPAAYGAVLIHYDFTGSVAGSTYNEPGGTPGSAAVRLDANGNAPVVSGGIISSNNDTGVDEGLVANTSAVQNINLGTTQFIAEALARPAANQGAGNFQSQGLLFEGYGWNFGFIGNDLFGGYWDGSAYPLATAPGAIGTIVPTTEFTHVAAVYSLTNGGTGSRMDIYADGVQVATHSSGTNFNGDLGPLVGLLNIDRATDDRGYTGDVDALALSTFTGDFDPGSFVLPVPEPASLSVLVLPAAALLARRRR